MAKSVKDPVIESESELTWQKPFFTIWTGQAISLIGSRLVQFALIWWLTLDSGSPGVLAAASLVGMIPYVVLGPFAGALIDRWDRKRVMIIADTVIAAATLLLGYLFMTGAVKIWMVYSILFIRALGGVFHQPAMSASTSLMVPGSALSRVQGANQALQGALSIISAPLGALLLAIMPINNILFIDVLSAAAAIIPLFFIAVPNPVHYQERGPERPFLSVWTDFKAGLRYLTAWKGLLLLLFIALMINMVLAPANAMMPLYIKDHFQGGALELSWVQVGLGAGILIGGLVLSSWGGFRKRMLTVLSGLLGLGIGLTVVGFSPGNMLSLAITGIFISGVMLSITNGSIQAILQASIEPGMQGRVFTLVGSLSSVMSPLGLIIAGPLAELTSVQTWFIIGGVLTVILSLGGFSNQTLLEMEKSSPGKKKAWSTPK